jgi:hypothetical protein
MSESQLTKRIGALVWFGVFAIYFATMAPTTSFWDCGEFIAAAFTLGVPHPPGSPLFNLVGRVFSMLPFDGVLKAVGLIPDFSDQAVRVTIMSPLAGAFSALFTYLVILRLIRGWGGELARERVDWSAQVGAITGTFIFALADSNWFNAVEAEVYAYAIFLMMLALWLGLKWADSVGKPGHLSYGLFIAYLMGLAGGMHLLCLLVLPSIAILALFTYVHDRRDAWTMLGAISLLVAGGYFGLHFLNARAIDGDPMASPASTYGLASDAVSYMQLSLTFAILFGVSGLVLTFLTRTVSWRDTWTVLLIGVAALATIRTATGIFFYSQSVADFPVGTIVVGVVSAALLFVLSGGPKKPNVPILKGYHLSVALLILAVVGYSTYLTLLARSGLNPIIDENNPENWHNFFNFLARKQYGTESMSLTIFERRADIGWQFRDMLVKYLFQQFPASVTGALFDLKMTFRAATQPSTYGMRVPDLPLLLMFLGVIWHLENDRKRFLAMALLWAITGLGLAVYLNMPDPQPRERHYVFTGATSVMAIWMGMGVTGLIRSVPTWLPAGWSDTVRNRVAPYSMAAIGLFVPVWFLIGYPLVDEYSADRSVRYTNWAKHNRRTDTVAFDYAFNILESCDRDGILFTNGDNDTFPLWYLQEVAGVRKDVRVVNLSLLNTDWYIQQLRDNPPELPLDSGYTDRYISDVLCGSTLPALVRSGRLDVGPNGNPFDEEGRLVGWQTKDVSVSADTARAVLNDGSVVSGLVRDNADASVSIHPTDSIYWIDIPSDAELSRGKTKLSWALAASSEYRWLRVQDVMVYNIIRWVNWERPIYFAVTVSRDNRIGLDAYLRMEGMVLRLEPNKDPQVVSGTDSYGMNPVRTEFSLDSVYNIRNLLDQEVYKDDNMLKLISNYRSAYLQLASDYSEDGRYDQAVGALDKLEERLPLDWRSSYSAATIARRGGPRMEDVSERFARLSGELLDREIRQASELGMFQMEMVRRTAQILRYSNASDGAASLLETCLQIMDRSGTTSPIDRLAILFEAAMATHEAGALEKAQPMYEQVSSELDFYMSSPGGRGAIQQILGSDPNRISMEVHRRMREVEEILSTSANAPDTVDETMSGSGAE